MAKKINIESPILYSFIKEKIVGFDNFKEIKIFFNKEEQATLEDKIKDLFSEDILKQYVENIFKYEKTLGISFRYYQFLALFFSEYHLDNFFNNKENYLLKINNFIEEKYKKDLEKDEELKEKLFFKEEDLGNIAFWMATGSGKTFVSLANILQFEKYNPKNTENELKNKIFITFNDTLLNQIKNNGKIDFKNIKGKNLDKKYDEVLGGYFQGINLIKKGERVPKEGESFYVLEEKEHGNNLILVDEAHLGAKNNTIKGAYKIIQNKLRGKNGLKIEYSATFHDVIEEEKKFKSDLLYLKTIIFDYNYHKFHDDGFGKDYDFISVKGLSKTIKKVDKKGNEKIEDTGEIKDDYFNEFSLSNLYFFLKQQEKYEIKKEELKNYYKPLMLYVGANVTGGSQSVIKIIKFYNYLLELLKDLKENDKNIYEIIDEKLKGEDSEVAKKLKEKIIDEINKNYTYGEKTQLVFNLLKRFFNIENILEQDKLNFHLLRGSNSKEDIVVVNIGNNKPFMAIYIGDESSLFKILEEELGNEIEIRRKFSDINHKDYNIGKIAEKNNDINVLIGTTKKFGVGYDNYRISTIGLLNIDKSNIEAVQLFGRGVRIKGCKNNGKRCYLNIDKNDKQKYFTYKILETLYVFSDSASALETFLQVNNLDVKLTFNIDLKTDFEELLNKKLENFSKLNVFKQVIEKQKFEILKQKIEQINFEKININNGKNIVIKTMSNIFEGEKEQDNEKREINFDGKIKVENGNITLLIEFYKTKLNFEKYLQEKIKKEFIKRFKDILAENKKIELNGLFDNLKQKIENLLDGKDNIFEFKNDVILDFKEMFSGGESILGNTISGGLNLDKIDKNYIKIKQIIDLAIDNYLKTLAGKIKNNFISYKEETFDKKQKYILGLKSYSIIVDIKDFWNNDKTTNDGKQYLKDFLVNIGVKIKKEEKLFSEIEKILNNSKLKEINLNNFLNLDILNFSIQEKGGRNYTYLGEHLYNYLYSTEKNKNNNYKINIKPDLVESEIKFIEDLKEYLKQETNVLIKNGYRAFIVRNIPKKGVGFYQEEFEKNRYPDFILWLVSYDKNGKLDFDNQKKVFIEPHGIHNEEDLENLTKLPESLVELGWKYFILAPGYCDKINNNNNIICMEDENYIEKIFNL